MQIYFFLLLRQNRFVGIKMNFRHFIREVPDFPEKGVVFKDITPLLEDPKAFQAATDALFGFTQGLQIDKVVGIESRGFFFAPLLASRLGAGFIPARKPGKLPRRTEKKTYQLEYGTDSLEIHAESIDPGDQVLIHDDVLATGGTARAMCDLIEKLGGKVVQCNFLIELGFLGGRKLLNGIPYKSLIEY